MQLKHLFLLLSLLSCAAGVQAMSAEEAFELGKSSGSKANNQGVVGQINNGQGATVINNYSGSAPSQAGVWTGNRTILNNLYSGGTSKIAECGSLDASASAADKQHCEAVNSIVDQPNKRPPDIVTRGDPLLQKGKVITADPEAIAGAIDGTYSECTTTTKMKESNFVMTTCDDWAKTDKAACTLGQVVVVDPDYIYKCSESLKVMSAGTCSYGRVVQVDAQHNYQCRVSVDKLQTYKCRKTLYVMCDAPHDGCDTGGIVPGSTQGDMRIWFGPSPKVAGDYWLEFGTFANNYWPGYATIYDRTLTFNIANLDKVTEFAAIHANFDDYLGVVVNGEYIIYIGPYGGTTLGVEYVCYENGCETYVTTGPGYLYPPELNTNWDINGYIDLRPYLRNGTNTIFTRTIVTGYGESAIRIKARMACPLNCFDNWDNQCQTYEARSQ